MMRKFIGCCSIFLLVSCLDETRVDPATPSTFVRYINGGNNDFAVAMEKTSDGGYLVMANTTIQSGDSLIDKIKLVRVNPYGSVLWTRVIPETVPTTVAGFHGNGLYISRHLIDESLEKYSDDGYIISGEVIYINGEIENQLLIVETDTEGLEIAGKGEYNAVDMKAATVWVGPGVGDSTTGHVSGLAVTKVVEGDVADKRFLVMAGVTGVPKNMILAELNLASSPPSLTWDESYGSAASTPVNKIFIDENQAVVIGGTVTFNNQTDLRVVKAAQNSPGAFDDRSYGDPGLNERANNICRTPNGFAIIGSTDGDEGDRDIYFTRLSESGDTLSTKVYPVFFPGTTEVVRESEEGNAICTTSDNGFIILATIESSISNDLSIGRGETDYYLMKINAFGDVEWTRAFGSLREDIGISVAQADDGGYLILGRTRLANLWTITLIKTNSVGEIE